MRTGRRVHYVTLPHLSGGVNTPRRHRPHPSRTRRFSHVVPNWKDQPQSYRNRRNNTLN